MSGLLPITVNQLAEYKRQGRKFAAVSCYDYWTARLAWSAGAEMLLVGDSAAQALLGHPTTLPADMPLMLELTAAVRRGAPLACLVADMPFLSYQTSIADAVRNAGQFLKVANVQLVKFELSAAYVDLAKAVCDAGIPLMAHLGIRPQTVAQAGALKAQGATAQDAIALVELAERMVEIGASALLLEGVAREAAAAMTQRCPVPVVSCGSGPDCDGQVLIAADILGITEGEKPKFARAFAQLGPAIQQAFGDYVRQTQDGRFPTDQESYHLRAGQAELFQQWLQNRKK